MIKHYTLLFFSFAIAIATLAQPTVISLSQADMPSVGWRNITERDTFPVPAISYGLKGTNRVYDFSNLITFAKDTVKHLALTSQQQSKFPQANLAVTTNNQSFLFVRNTATNQIWEGLEGELLPGVNTDITFNPKPEVYRFPTTYNGTFSGSWGFQKVLPGSAVGQPVHEIRLTFTAQYNDTIDGWGKLITPHASYKCLRNQRRETSRTLIEVKILSFSPWSTVSDTRDTTLRWNYHTKETKGAAITFSFDTAGYENQVSWSLINPTVPIANFSYSVGGSGLTTFTDLTDGYPDSWSWTFGDGSSQSTLQNPTHTYAANGKYQVCLTVTNVGGSNTYCDSVNITTIGATNNPPVAVNDAVNCTQNSFVDIDPTINDSDPDNNALGVTSLGTPTNGTAIYVGNTITYTPTSGFLGLDSFSYTICDNGSPSLCATAKVFVTVVRPLILPSASFTYVPYNGSSCGYIFRSTSQNADSLSWKFTDLNTPARDTIGKGDSIIISAIPFNYKVCLYAYNSDGVDSTCSVISHTCVGINETAEVSYFVVPNPASDEIIISNSIYSMYGIEKINIIDMTGRTIKSASLENTIADRTIINVNEIPEGMYVAEIVRTDGSRTSKHKFSIQR
jgi:PKD repeat protein